MLKIDISNIVNRIRIKITDRCNYRCFFCHGEGSIDFRKELNKEDIEFVLKIFRNLGVRRLKITGGEPLLREDIVYIVRKAKEIGYEDISLTTNGLLLDKYMYDLYKAGLDRIDISLHTLNCDKYIKITGTCREYFYKVVSNIEEISNINFKQVKINMLVTSINVEDILDMLKFAKKIGATLQLIEYMPIGRGIAYFKKYYIPLKSIYYTLSRRAKFITFRRDIHNRPILNIDDVYVEFVMGFRNPDFCSGCRQLRLTSDGRLRYCIYRNDEEDLYNLIKSRDVHGVVDRILKLLSRKSPMFSKL